MTKVNCIADSNCLLGESPRWNAKDEKIYWSDIDGKKIWRMNADLSAQESVNLAQKAGCFVFSNSGDMILAMEDGIYIGDPFANPQELELLAKHPNISFSREGGRFNDGRCDFAGRFYLGTIDPSKKGKAAFYVLEPNAHELKLVQEGFSTFNGIAFHPNQKEVWYTDTPQKKLFRSSYDINTGVIGEREVVCSWPSDNAGRPDGASFDKDGNYWCAMYAGGQVLKINPNGEIELDIKIPATYTTMTAFVGNSLNRLVVTTGQREDDPEEKSRNPKAGGLFEISLDNLRGIPENKFAN